MCHGVHRLANARLILAIKPEAAAECCPRSSPGTARRSWPCSLPRAPDRIASAQRPQLP